MVLNVTNAYVRSIDKYDVDELDQCTSKLAEYHIPKNCNGKKKCVMDLTSFRTERYCPLKKQMKLHVEGMILRYNWKLVLWIYCSVFF